MSILDLAAVFSGLLCLQYILLTILFFNILSGCQIRFFCNSGRVCTQIRNQTNGSMTLDIYTFIKLLSQTHGFLSRKIQNL